MDGENIRALLEPKLSDVLTDTEEPDAGSRTPSR